MKQRQEKNLKVSKNIEIQLLMQAYSRFVSRAHTVFETLFEVIFAIVSITIALVFSLVQIGAIPWNKFYFIQVLIIDGIMCTAVFIVAFITLYDSRKKRAEIVSKVKSLDAA